MDHLFDASSLLKLDQDCLREVCCYLSSQSLFQLWAANNRHLQALLCRSKAFDTLSLSPTNPIELADAILWMKSASKPQIRSIEFDDIRSTQDASFWLLWRNLLRHCTAKSMNFCVRDSLKAVGLLPNEESKTCIFRLWIISERDAGVIRTSLKQLPTTITDLTLKGFLESGGSWLSLSLKSLSHLTKLTIQSDCTDYLDSGSLLEGLASFPYLHTLKWRSIQPFRSGFLIFDVPTTITDLDIEWRHHPLMIWPPALQRLEFNVRVHAPVPNAAVSRMIGLFNWATLKHAKTELLHVSYLLPTLADEPYSISDWGEYVSCVDPSTRSRFIPSGLNLKSFVKTTNFRGNWNISLITSFPASLTSLEVQVVDGHLARLAESLTFHLPSISTLKLHLGRMWMDERGENWNPDDSGQIFSLPSTITSLAIQSYLLSIKLVESLLPTSLTRLTTGFASLGALTTARAKLGPNAKIVCLGAIEIGTMDLEAMFPKLGALSSVGNNDASSEHVDEQEDTHAFPARNTMICGPYGTYRFCDASGNWKVNGAVILNKMAELVGHRTTSALHISSASEWPSSVTNISFAEYPDKRSVGLCLTDVGSSMLQSKSIVNLELSPSVESYPVARDAQSFAWKSLDVGNNPLPALTLPPSLTLLKSSYWTYAWPQLTLPSSLTVIDLSNFCCPLKSISLPTGLRELSVNPAPSIYDHELRQVLLPLSQLTKVSFSASGVVLTAPNCGPSLTLQDLVAGFSSYLRPDGHLQCTFRKNGSHQRDHMVAIYQLPPGVTSIDLLRLKGSPLQSSLPSELKRYLASVTDKGTLPLLHSLLFLEHLHIHFRLHQHGRLPPLPSLPTKLEKIYCTTDRPILAAPSKQEKFFFAAPVLSPSNASLHTIVATVASIDYFVKGIASLKTDTVLPNLTRLVMNAGDCTDLELDSILKSHFPKLLKLTLTSCVTLTGRLVQDESFPDHVTWRSFVEPTWSKLNAILQSRLPAGSTRQIEDDQPISGLETINSATSTNNASLGAHSSESPSSNSPTSLIPELNIIFSVIHPLNATPNQTFRIPPKVSSLHLLLPANHQYLQSFDIKYGYGDTADVIEQQLRPRRKLMTPFIPLHFDWTYISNAAELQNLVEIHYHSKSSYHPGTFFRYPNLKTLKIFCPIQADKDSLKYPRWVIPAGLTHLTVFTALQSFEFATENDDKASQLLTLELPRAVWQSEDPLPCNLTRLAILNINSQDIRNTLVDRGCEIVLT